MSEESSNLANMMKHCPATQRAYYDMTQTAVNAARTSTLVQKAYK